MASVAAVSSVIALASICFNSLPAEHGMAPILAVFFAVVLLQAVPRQVGFCQAGAPTARALACYTSGRKLDRSG
jgi:hypothetical protein